MIDVTIKLDSGAVLELGSFDDEIAAHSALDAVGPSEHAVATTRARHAGIVIERRWERASDSLDWLPATG